MDSPIFKPHKHCRKGLILILILAFISSGVGPFLAQAQDFQLPTPGSMVLPGPAYNPPLLKGLKVHPDNPFRFDFILDKGDSNPQHMSPPQAFGGGPQQEQLKQESTKLIKYFLASLTIPEKDLWVNLSPYEKNRIIPDAFGRTEMGRDLLAEDYMLKQITSSLIYPEGETGKKFWKKVYAQAAKRFGTTNIPVNTFNKVWIVPEKAVVYENAKAGTAYVVESKLKVMLEEDYLSKAKHGDVGVLPSGISVSQNGDSPPVNNDKGTVPILKDPNIRVMGSQMIREIVIPELTKEVNTGANFAQLRQVYNSLILATWYKKKIKDSILTAVYANKNKIQGITITTPGVVEVIYQRYLQAFKKGSYNFIKEETDPVTHQPIPHKYFSGGLSWAGVSHAMLAIHDWSKAGPIKGSHLRLLKVDMASISRQANDTLEEVGRIITENGVLNPWYVKLNMAYRKLINPQGKDLTVAVGYPGVDVHNVWLATGFRTAIWIVSNANLRKLTKENLDEDISDWANLNWENDYFNNKKKYGFSDSFLADENPSRRILEELKSMGADQVSAEFKDNTVELHFHLPFDESPRKIVFTEGNLLFPSFELSQMLKGNIDVFYEKASLDSTDYSPSKIGFYGNWLKPGGILAVSNFKISDQPVSVDRFLPGFINVSDDNGEINLLKAERKALNIGHAHYGWDLSIWQKPEESNLSRAMLTTPKGVSRRGFMTAAAALGAGRLLPREVSAQALKPVKDNVLFKLYTFDSPTSNLRLESVIHDPQGFFPALRSWERFYSAEIEPLGGLLETYAKEIEAMNQYIADIQRQRGKDITDIGLDLSGPELKWAVGIFGQKQALRDHFRKLGLSNADQTADRLILALLGPGLWFALDHHLHIVPLQHTVFKQESEEEINDLKIKGLEQLVLLTDLRNIHNIPQSLSEDIPKIDVYIKLVPERSKHPDTLSDVSPDKYFSDPLTQQTAQTFYDSFVSRVAYRQARIRDMQRVLAGYKGESLLVLLGQEDIDVLLKGDINQSNGNRAMTAIPAIDPETMAEIKRDIAFVKPRLTALLHDKKRTWEQKRSEVMDLKGKWWGITNSSGAIAMSRINKVDFKIPVLGYAGDQANGWAVKIEDVQIYQGICEFTLELRRGAERKTVALQAAHFVEPIRRGDRTEYVLELSNRLGINELRKLVLKLPNHDWTADQDLPNIDGLLLGSTNGYGTIQFKLQDLNFIYTWPVLGRHEEGWEIRVVKARVVNGIYEMDLKFSKEGKESYRRIVQLGPYQRNCHGIHEARYEPPYRALDISEGMAQYELPALLSEYKRQWTQQELDRLAGLSMGYTTAYGGIFINIAHGYNFSWHLIKFKDWRCVIQKIIPKDQGYVLVIRMTKDGKSIFRTYDLGPELEDLDTEIKGMGPIKIWKVTTRERLSFLSQESAEGHAAQKTLIPGKNLNKEETQVVSTDELGRINLRDYRIGDGFIVGMIPSMKYVLRAESRMAFNLYYAPLRGSQLDLSPENEIALYKNLPSDRGNILVAAGNVDVMQYASNQVDAIFASVPRGTRLLATINDLVTELGLERQVLNHKLADYGIKTLTKGFKQTLTIALVGVNEDFYEKLKSKYGEDSDIDLVKMSPDEIIARNKEGTLRDTVIITEGEAGLSLYRALDQNWEDHPFFILENNGPIIRQILAERIASERPSSMMVVPYHRQNGEIGEFFARLDGSLDALEHQRQRAPSMAMVSMPGADQAMPAIDLSAIPLKARGDYIVRETKRKLASIISKGPNYDWVAHAHELPDLTGGVLGITDEKGMIFFEVFKDFVYFWTILGPMNAGLPRKGWKAVIIESGVKNGLYEFSVEFSQEGQNSFTRTFQIGSKERILMGRRQERGNIKAVLDIDDRLGLTSLTEMTSMGSNYDWKSNFDHLPNPIGQNAGITDLTSRIYFAVHRPITQEEIESAYLNIQWHEFIEIIERERLGKVIEPGKVILTISAGLQKDRISRIFGTDFDKIFPILQSPIFIFPWTLLPYQESGWRATFTGYRVQNGELELEVELRKKYQQPITRGFRLGQATRMLQRKDKRTGQTQILEVLDIVPLQAKDAQGQLERQKERLANFLVGVVHDPAVPDVQFINQEIENYAHQQRAFYVSDQNGTLTIRNFEGQEIEFTGLKPWTKYKLIPKWKEKVEFYVIVQDFQGQRRIFERDKTMPNRFVAETLIVAVVHNERLKKIMYQVYGSEILFLDDSKVAFTEILKMKSEKLCIVTEGHEGLELYRSLADREVYFRGFFIRTDDPALHRAIISERRNKTHPINIAISNTDGEDFYNFFERVDGFLDQAQLTIINKSGKNNLAQSADTTGGIDMTSVKVGARGLGMRFHMDPAMVQKLEQAAGFEPVIIKDEPLTDLKRFIGA